MTHITIVVVVLLSFIAIPAHAGFFVHRPASINRIDTTIGNPSHKLVNERPHARSKWRLASIIVAATGILFPPFGILAIVFSVLSLANRERPNGLAITGLTLGILEIIFVIIVLIALSQL